jgi:hypothetical protein
MDTKNLTQVDHTAIRVNQAVIIFLNIVAFILDAHWLAGIVAIAMLIGTLLKAAGFIFVYRILRSVQIIKPDYLQDNPEPHRFAQGFGGLVMLAGAIVLFSGATVVGWGLIWMVTALAALNLFGGFCFGCAVYYWLSRLHVPGFTKKPPANTLPGMRPKVEA